MGGGNSAATAASKAEAKRQAAITATTGRINAVYDAPARQAQYNDFLGALRTQFTDDATRQKTVADRNRKFAIARGGLSGGSADVDSRRTLGEEFNKGLLTAESKAQGGLADLKGQDENSRNQLLSLAQTGLDSTSAAARAGAAMQTNAQGALSSSVANGLGDIFGQTADVYKKQQDAAAFRRGQQSPVGSLYGTSPF